MDLLTVNFLHGYSDELLIGFVFGFITRIWLLRSDYRQYPSFPHSYIIHLTLGAMAALVGAALFPSLAEKDFAAVTFLLLVATQFRDIRKIERDTLHSIDAGQLVHRGAEYIEGIARVFEARNYLAMAASVVASGLTHIWGLWAGVFAGIITLLVVANWRSGKTIGDIADVSLADVKIKGSDLFVGDIYIMNVGLPETKQQIRDWAVGILIKGKSQESVRTLGSVGQRDAVIHDLVDIFGMKKDVAEPEFTPMARKDHDNGTVAIYYTPMFRDEQAIIKMVKKVPVLESSHMAERDGKELNA